MGAAHDESEQPQDENHDSYPPQQVECESRAEQKQREQKNNEYRSHDYQPPSRRLPLLGASMHR